MAKRIAVYAGTFDIFTKGHLDVMYRSLSICDELMIAIGVNPEKKTLFSMEERKNQILNLPCIKYELSNRVKVSSFEGLLVKYAKSIGATVLIRGIRSVSDFEYEINLANINKVLEPEIETIFLPTKPELSMISSSMVKELVKLGVDISSFVPDVVANAVYKIQNTSQ